MASCIACTCTSNLLHCTSCFCHALQSCICLSVIRNPQLVRHVTAIHSYTWLCRSWLRCWTLHDALLFKILLVGFEASVVAGMENACRHGVHSIFILVFSLYQTAGHIGRSAPSEWQMRLVAWAMVGLLVCCWSGCDVVEAASECAWLICLLTLLLDSIKLQVTLAQWVAGDYY